MARRMRMPRFRRPSKKMSLTAILIVAAAGVAVWKWKTLKEWFSKMTNKG